MGPKKAALVLSAALLGVWGPTASAQEQDFSKVEITTTKLSEGVYMLAGAGGNMGLMAGPDGAFLIDDEYAPLTPKIKAAVAAVTDKPIRFLLNTHWHGDHTGGNKDMGEAGTLIVAHDNVRLRLSSDQFIEAFKMKVAASPAKALPIVTFDSAVTFHINGDEVKATHLPPAHTDGDSFIRFRAANVIHAGDLFFNGHYPFVDISSGGSFEGMISATEAMAAAADEHTKIIPGHGPLSDRAGLKAFHDMLVKVRDRILPMVKAGKTLAEVTAAKPTQDLDGTWGKGFLNGDAFVAVAFASLAKGAPAGKK